MAIETKLFDISERNPVPVSQIAIPSDITIFGTGFGDNEYYGDYSGIAKKYPPRRILEIGVRFGYSGFAMCKGALAAGMQNVEYVGMDAEYFSGPTANQSYNNYRSNAVAAENFRRFIPEVNTEFITINTQHEQFPPSVAFSQFDLINVDGDHSYEGCLKDMTNCWPLLRDGGIMIVDDTGMVDVKQAIAKCLETWNCEYQWYANERGFAIIRRGF